MTATTDPDAALRALQRRHDDWMRSAERLHLDLIALRVDVETTLAQLTEEAAR
ncbi:MAG: hypothetical protein R6T85_01375 [Egibacteraceae bacterium]